jgi:hypothetical protein
VKRSDHWEKGGGQRGKALLVQSFTRSANISGVNSLCSNLVAQKWCLCFGDGEKRDFLMVTYTMKKMTQINRNEWRGRAARVFPL